MAGEALAMAEEVPVGGGKMTMTGGKTATSEGESARLGGGAELGEKLGRT